MRVAVNGWFWHAANTGSGQYTRRLVEALARLEPSVCVAVLVPGEIKQQSDAPNVRLHPHPIRRTRAGKVWWEQAKVARLARRLDADVLHVPYWAPPIASQIPTVVTIHDLIPRLLPAYRGGTGVRLYTALVSATARHTHAVLTDSTASRRDIVRELGIAEDRVRAIPLAVDDSLSPTPSADDAAVRRRLDCPQCYVVYLDGFDVRKDLRSVMATYARVRAWRKNVGLVVAGSLPTVDTAFSPDPRRLAQEAGLPDGAVRFVGFVDEADKPALLRGARAMIFPSVYEGFGYPPLEAIACGTPVVGCDNSSIPEVVGKAGVLTKAGDIDGMAGALIQLVGDDAFHGRLSEAAMIQASQFSWRETAAATLEAYREVARGARARTK